MASLCHALKVDAAKEVQTPIGRPIKIVDGGKVGGWAVRVTSALGRASTRELCQDGLLAPRKNGIIEVSCRAVEGPRTPRQDDRSILSEELQGD